MPAPIVLFVYNRLDHTRRTIESLMGNFLAKESDLIVYSDAAHMPCNQKAVDEVRAYLKTVKGFRFLEIYHRPYNFGLANSIIQGVTDVLHKFENVVVLEDDMITSPYFLTYMNDALNKYADDERVISIHGYVYPVEQKLPEAFFLIGADCWGWATWRSGWELFNSDGQQLLNELKHRKLLRSFDFNGSYSFSKMLKDQTKGINDSWAVRWYASAFLADKLTLYPGRSLVHNIGNDNSGTHCGKSTSMDSDLNVSPINLHNITVDSSLECKKSFEIFFKKIQNGKLKRIVNKVRSLFKMKK